MPPSIRQPEQRNFGPEAGPSNSHAAQTIYPDPNTLPPGVSERVSYFRSQWEASQRTSAWAHETSSNRHRGSPLGSNPPPCDPDTGQASGSEHPPNNPSAPPPPHRGNSQGRDQNPQVFFFLLCNV